MARRKQYTKPKLQQTQSQSKKINVSIDAIAEGKAKKIVNINGDYVMTDIITSDTENIIGSIESATYDMAKLEHVYSKSLEKETASYVTTLEELTTLAQNTQSKMEKVVKINGIVKYYINKEDLIGRVMETIENNINTNFTINYPNIPTEKKKDKKMFDEMKAVFDKFNNQIDVVNLIRENGVSTYGEGNYLFYLKGNKDIGYGIVSYPLEVVEITSMNVDGEPIIAFNVVELKTRLQTNINKYGRQKSKQPIQLLNAIKEEIKRDYPIEVFDAYEINDNYAFLNPERVGLCRINNLKGCYGVTPIFKALTPQLMLETLDKVDRKNLIAKAKKIYFQSTRKEMMDSDSNQKKMKFTNEIGYAHTSLLQSMGNDTIVYTAMPYVENLQILEPNQSLTDANTILGYRNRVLNALGIGFLSNESKSSFNTTTVNVDELLKTVNKISKQLEPIINKFYKMVCIENGFPVEFAPTISIQSTDLLSREEKLKLVETLYSKIGVSYDTVLTLLGLDPDTEIRKRIAENKYLLDGVEVTMDDIMSPHITSFTTSGKEGDTITHNDAKTNKNGSAIVDPDRNIIDKNIQDAKA